MNEFSGNAEHKPWLRPELVAPWWEVALVLGVMLGPFAYSSSRFALTNQSPDFISHMVSNPSFLRLIAIQGGLLAALFFYLRWRGWTPADFGIRMNWAGTLLAPVLAMAAAFANLVVAGTLKVLLVWQAHPNDFLQAWMAQAPHIPKHSIVVAWSLIVVGSVVNAYLEELVFMAYGFNQFAAKRGPVFAIFAMALLRMLLHTYKGPVDMLGIAAFSFVFGAAYWYGRRLWPLIFAHAGIDLAAFSLLKVIFGR